MRARELSRECESVTFYCYFIVLVFYRLLLAHQHRLNLLSNSLKHAQGAQGDPLVGLLVLAEISPGLVCIGVFLQPAALGILLFKDQVDSTLQAGILAESQANQRLARVARNKTPRPTLLRS